MIDVVLIAAILIALWVFFVFARTRRNNKTSLPLRPLTKDGQSGLPPAETENWSFEPESGDRIEQADHWVLG